MATDDPLEMETGMYVAPSLFRAAVLRVFHVPSSLLVRARLDFDAPTTTQHITRQQKNQKQKSNFNQNQLSRYIMS
jgi:hypothetical protein